MWENCDKHSCRSVERQEYLIRVKLRNYKGSPLQNHCFIIAYIQNADEECIWWDYAHILVTDGILVNQIFLFVELCLSGYKLLLFPIFVLPTPSSPGHLLLTSLYSTSDARCIALKIICLNITIIIVHK